MFPAQMIYDYEGDYISERKLVGLLRLVYGEGGFRLEMIRDRNVLMFWRRDRVRWYVYLRDDVERRVIGEVSRFNSVEEGIVADGISRWEAVI